MALIFIHFEPTGTALHQDEQSGIYHRQSGTGTATTSVEELYRANIAKGVAGPEHGTALPPYIQRESPEEAHWKAENPEGWTPPAKVLPNTAHVAAKTGNLAQLAQALEEEEETKRRRRQRPRDSDEDSEEADNPRQTLLTERDENGWQVLHQGVVSGNKDIVELLIQRGASINSRTHGGYGETPLRIAEKWHGRDHPIVQYLRSLGALSLGPEL